MSDNRRLIQRAGKAVKAGDTQQAKALLLQAVRQNSGDYVAWLGLARVTASPQASLDYALRAARLQPGDPLVQKVLAWAEKRAATAVPNQSAVPTGGRKRTAVFFTTAVILIILLGLGGLWIGNNLTGRQPVTNRSLPAATSTVMPAQAGRDLPQQALLGDAAAATAVPTATPRPTQPVIPTKHIAQGKEGEVRPTWTLTPTPTNTPTPSPTPLPTFVSPDNSQPSGRPFGVGANERWVDVNLSTQTLTAFEGNTAVYATLISSGLPAYPTVTGQFRIWLRYESQTMDGSRLGYDYYLTGVPYVMYFYQDYALHGTYWHSNFGYPMSHGCVNMETGDAQWLYNFTTIGTVVNVHY